MLGLALYIITAMLIYRWFAGTILDWMSARGVTPKYGIIALYRLSNEDPLGEEGLASAVGPCFPVLIPLALLEFGIRLLIQQYCSSMPTTLVV